MPLFLTRNKSLWLGVHLVFIITGYSTKAKAEPEVNIAHSTDVEQEVVTSADERNESSWYSEFKVVPFGFLSDSIGNSIGAAGLLKGVGQPQAALLGVGFVSDKGSYVTYLGGYNYQLSERWLVDGDAYLAQFKDYNYYLGDATQNNAQFDDYIEADGRESRLQAKFRYVLPLGLGQTLAAQAGYAPNRKITGMTPWDSGVTTASIEPFYKTRYLDDVSYEEAESTWGVNVRLDWDNRDSTRNTTQGSRTTFDYTYAPELGNDDSWSTWEFQNSQYLDIGSLGDIFNKQVIAFDFYTAGAPSWESDGQHKPPEYAGVRLGGLYRQRGFSSGRFTGRAAINYSLEYRVMPDWQPLQNWPVFNWYSVPWWQWVLFTDVGRVADEYDLSELHQDMQVSYGGAVRFQVEGIVVRAEMAWGDEESMFRVMVNQPF